MALRMDQAEDVEGLIRSAREGRREAFDALVSPGLAGLGAAARKLTGNGADADDLLQDTLTDAFRGIHTLNQPGAWRGWIYQILVRNNYDRLRHKRRDPVAGPRAPSADPLESLLDRETRDLARQTLDSMEEKFKSVLTLRYLQGLSLGQVAEQTRRPLGTVKSLVHQGLRAFDAAFRRRLS